MTVVCEPFDLEPASEEQGLRKAKLVQSFYGLCFYWENLASGRRLKACLAFLQMKKGHKSFFFFFGCQLFFRILIFLFNFYLIFPVFSPVLFASITVFLFDYFMQLLISKILYWSNKVVK